MTLNTGGLVSNVTAAARGNTFATATQTALPMTIPDTSSITATSSDGLASNTTTLDLSNSALSISFDQTRSNAFGSISFSKGSIYFSVDQSINYDFSGAYAAVDPLGRLIELQGELVNRTSNTTLFSNTQSSRNTPNESFVLGQEGGDASNTLVGSLTGVLNPGETYELSFYAAIQANFTGTAATANGEITLAFVPEPSSALLVGLGLAALGGLRRPSSSS